MAASSACYGLKHNKSNEKNIIINEIRYISLSSHYDIKYTVNNNSISLCYQVVLILN